jgi:hypothetical protein
LYSSRQSGTVSGAIPDRLTKRQIDGAQGP